MKPTKQHIQEHALKLFNEKGFVNVRLQHIADAAFVSVGHLAYHFRNKDAIVEALFEQLKHSQELLLNEFRVVPLFEDLDRYLRQLYQLQQQFIFFYLDRVEVWRAYPQLKERYGLHIAWQRQQWLYLVDFNIARSSLQAMEPAQREMLVWQLQSLTDHWRYICQSSTVEDNSQQFLAHVWGVLAPYLTNMGQRELAQLKAWNEEQGG